MSVKRRDLLKNTAGFLASTAIPSSSFADLASSRQTRSTTENTLNASKQLFLAKAEISKPQLRKFTRTAVAEVIPVRDSSKFLRWRMERKGSPSELEKKAFKGGDIVFLDFGEHLTGYFSFKIEGIGVNIDAPARLRMVFGEVPGDVAEDFHPYHGQLSQSWLPDEVFNIDPLPQLFRVPRRHAFRYLKIEIVSTSPNYVARFSSFSVEAYTAASAEVSALPSGTPQSLIEIDRVSLATLRDCMQTVFEDGPRRDQRLWIGDLRLQALTNYVSFRNSALVKRCLYLLAAFPREDGLIRGDVFEKPEPKASGDFLLDYAALFPVVLQDYVENTSDLETARDLWPTALQQLKLATATVTPEGLFVDPRNIWIFIDWRRELHRDASMQGLLIFALKKAHSLAVRLNGKADAEFLDALITKMSAAARTHFYDSSQSLFISGPERQISWASQAWLVIAGILSKDETATVLKNALKHEGILSPVTPYLNHYVVEALQVSGLHDEALSLIDRYWGGMVRAGADTFWEVYDPADSKASPYGDVHINSFCHAWSCTPSYFLRAKLLTKSSSFAKISKFQSEG
jgi:alpha-L-rhamnosidase